MVSKYKVNHDIYEWFIKINTFGLAGFRNSQVNRILGYDFKDYKLMVHDLLNAGYLERVNYTNNKRVNFRTNEFKFIKFEMLTNMFLFNTTVYFRFTDKFKEELKK